MLLFELCSNLTDRMPTRLPAQLFHSLDSSPSLPQTKQLHALLVTSALSLHLPLTTNLLRCYAANSDIPSAHHLFDHSPQRTTFLYNSIIRAHARYHSFATAFSLFGQMLGSSTPPDSHTLACVLRACADNSDHYGTRATHGVMFSIGLSSDHISTSALVRTYSKLGLVDDAVTVFDGMHERDLVLWNTMISGHANGGLCNKAVEMFDAMRRSGERADGYSLVGVMSCLRDPGVVWIGRGVHGLCVKGGYDEDVHVGSALVSMYLRCNILDSGYRVFRDFPQSDLVMWSTIISGLSKGGMCKEALDLFREMCCLGRKPDPVLIATVLSSCAFLAAVRPGEEIHSYIFRLGIERDIAVACALIDVYSKCGFLELGFRVFLMMPKKNLVAYNILLSGLAYHGLGCESIRLFEELLSTGLAPDKATFSALLCACCHSGLLKYALELFDRMACDFGMVAQMEHYVYMVKLLGSEGKVDEAYDFIRAMPILPDSGVWGAFLWACCAHGRLDLGEIAAQKLLETDPSKTAYRVMLSNMYAAKEKWGNAENLRSEMKEGSLQKMPGLSWI